MIWSWKSNNPASRDVPMARNGAAASAAASDQRSIVVIGVGSLGLPIAVRLRQAGFPLVGIDVSPDRAACAAARGIVMANSIVGATSGASIAISTVPQPAALQHLATQLQQCDDHRIRYVVDISPLSPSAKMRAAAAFEALGITLLDCALVGGSAQIMTVTYWYAPLGWNQRSETFAQCFPRSAPESSTSANSAPVPR